MARLLKIKFNNAKIFNIDLVESLQFYYIFIKYNFPKANILFVKNPEDIDHINNNYDFILIPNYFLDILINNENFKLINIDILINTIKDHGYTVAVNQPFIGCLIPSDYYLKDERVRGFMFEMNKRLIPELEKVGSLLLKIIEAIK